MLEDSSQNVTEMKYNKAIFDIVPWILPCIFLAFLYNKLEPVGWAC